MDYSVMDVKKHINSMIYLNVLSFSALSGCGICSQPRAEENEQLRELLMQLPEEQRAFNFYFSNSIYKRGLPQYDAAIDTPYDYEGFRWVDKKKKRVIDIEVMACSITACCNLIERLLTCDLRAENPNLMAYILYRTALNHADFIQKFLRVGDLYYSGEDAAEVDSEEQHIQIAASNPDRASQFAVLHAYSALQQLSDYNILFLPENRHLTSTALELLPVLLQSLIESLQEASSREIAVIGMQLAGIYKKTSHHRELVRKALIQIARELCQRTAADGEVVRSRSDQEGSSFMTAANCLNVLSQLGLIFSSKTCIEAASRIYDKLDSVWDSQHGLFKVKTSNKQSYSIKEISASMSALFSFCKIVSEPNLLDYLKKQISQYFNTAFVKSGIYNGQGYPILQHDLLELPKTDRENKYWAPVFNKSFEYKMSKKKYYCEADVFRADHVLPACVILLDSINI